MKHTKKKPALTERQKQVSDLHNKGVSVKDIALNLGIKTVTVYATLKSARRRLGEVTRLNGKLVKGVAVKAHSIGPGAGLVQLLAGLDSSFKSRNSKARKDPINIGCTFHPGDAHAKPKVYEIALSVADGLDKVAKLAKDNGKVFVRREFVLQAVADRLKEVLS
jgi:DNA-binding CsgD family transcriptional regulator